MHCTVLTIRIISLYTQHLTSLIHELEETEPTLLQKDLVAAYLVGWQLGEDTFKGTV
jgi:hypothetical protein